MNERENVLIRRIKEEHPGAWEDFQKDYTSVIFRTMDRHRLGHLVSDHEALANKILKQAFDYIKRAEIRRSLDALLYRITVTKIMSAAKPKPLPLRKEPVDLDPDPLEVMLIQEERRIKKKMAKYLKLCLELLTDTQKVVIDLWTKGFSQAEIARRRGVSPSAIHQAKTAAIRKLFKCLKERDREIS